MKRFFAFLATVLASFSLFSAVLSAPVYATEDEEEAETAGSMCENGTFLGFVPWYRGLTEEKSGRCEIIKPEGGDGLTTMIISIVLNILADLTMAGGLIAVGFVIYGGYLYIMASGDPGKVAKGKKTLVSAIVGLAITLSANVIMNLIVSILTTQAS